MPYGPGVEPGQPHPRGRQGAGNVGQPRDLRGLHTPRAGDRVGKGRSQRPHAVSDESYSQGARVRAARMGSHDVRTPGAVGGARAPELAADNGEGHAQRSAHVRLGHGLQEPAPAAQQPGSERPRAAGGRRGQILFAPKEPPAVRQVLPHVPAPRPAAVRHGAPVRRVLLPVVQADARAAPARRGVPGLQGEEDVGALEVRLQRPSGREGALGTHIQRPAAVAHPSGFRLRMGDISD
mmetsp:Transcript_57011/g.161886  ORF Transcript_57011/g.161886 Transcript_57011/m.161886 type:complete len:237 (-) Transcript_57011:524-1234(-)